MISHKRELDRHVYTYRPIFSDEFNACYDRFILDCFKLYGGWRKDAKLRTSAKHRNEEGEQEWADCFTGENNRKAIKKSHNALMEVLAKDLGMKVETE
jgi:hypothetical protein